MNWFKADRVQAVFAVASHLCSMCHFSAQRQLQPASPVTASVLAQARINAATELHGGLKY